MPDLDSPMRRRLIFATGNPGKVREMRDLLADQDWEVEALPEDTETFEETGSSFAENARGKALFASERTPWPVLADDSGLVIDALDGEPGVRSARYIDPEISQEERNRRVLEKLEGVPPEERTARFVCHLVLARRGEVVHETTGTCEGRIHDRQAGDGGFGYDPIFLVPELDRTFAQIPRKEKSARSHRGRAARDMARFLAGWDPPALCCGSGKAR